MVKVLVDTDVVIDCVKGRLELGEGVYYISEITLYELLRGFTDIERAKRLLEDIFLVVWNDNSILLRAAEIYRELRRRGVTISDADILIGATAIAKNMPLWTRNVKHFTPLAEFGLKLYREGPRPP
ncbi:PilT-like protein [Thermoproteus uzoniensis 768-20]|uniref:Ribonuclease VapC n=1 Tax=Thermoproteus uzoniensis (strain 768-20) TaxID=999630 RepID=F2L5R7_THEU7|nr:type II toxin-antitoxin system VapC family toxin [Thermoproteus uzoniensis]AEA13613.1 PilT-like protein [Thermoproteus uzoniensis 768-20]